MASETPLEALTAIEELLLFFAHLPKDPLQTVQEFPRAAAFVLAAPLIPAFLLLILKSLSAPKQINAIEQWKVQTPAEQREGFVEDASKVPEIEVGWEVGVTSTAVAVSEEGMLRAFHEVPVGKTITADNIYTTLLKAIVQPMDLLEPGRPRLISFLQSRQCSQKDIEHVVQKMKSLNIKVDIAENANFEMENLRLKRMDEMAKKSGKDKLIPTPNRSCIACHKDIEAKPSQCSACKAVIYCGADCAKQDWPKHKTMCASFKKFVQRIEENNLHDFPFEFYNDKKPLAQYNLIATLIQKGIHNVGVYRRLCGCFADIPYGELAAQQIARAEANGITDPLERFKMFGLSPEWYPLSKPFAEDIKVKDIDTWEKFYKARNIGMDDPAAFVLEYPMTLWHIINKHYVDKIQTNEDGRRQLTIHLAGAEKEADLCALFEVLLAFLPKTDIAVHMVSPNLSDRVESHFLTRGVSNETAQSTILITMRKGIYGPQHLSGELYRNEGLPFGTGKPDMVVAMNANLMMAQWGPTMQMLIANKQKTFITESMEHSVDVLMAQLKQVGIEVTPLEVNPFRQPCFQWQKDTNLPGWSNAFIFGLF
ncbi:hypothetical protein BC832DRAFT_594934 [Gaertneriomyces semiglobifer]|nr:hypothetical protein BC832DRAFT_594934 [Gaertneriomyces semiglobifer]